METSSAETQQQDPVRKVLLEVLGIFGFEISLYCYSANACQGAENVCELKAFLPLLSCCFRKSIYPVLGSSSLLSAAKQEQGRERQGHQHRTHLAMFYRFPLPASSNYSKKKTVLHKRCSWGINCQNMFAEKLLSQKAISSRK